jgi:hypothetical protein
MSEPQTKTEPQAQTQTQTQTQAQAQIKSVDPAKETENKKSTAIRLAEADVIIAHSPCLDGDAFVLIAKIFALKAKIIPFTPGTSKIAKKVVEGKNVVFGDCCPGDEFTEDKKGEKVVSKHVFKELVGAAKDVFHVDHHASAIDTYARAWGKLDAETNKIALTLPNNLTPLLHLAGSNPRCASMLLLTQLLEEGAIKIGDMLTDKYNSAMLRIMTAINFHDTGQFEKMSIQDKILHAGLTTFTGWAALAGGMKMGEDTIMTIGNPIYVENDKLRKELAEAKTNIRSTVKGIPCIYVMDFKSDQWALIDEMPLYFPEPVLLIFRFQFHHKTKFSMRSANAHPIDLNAFCSQFVTVEGHAATGGGHPHAANVTVFGAVEFLPK